MKHRLTFALSVWLLLVAASAYGDGKIYSVYSPHSERIPASIPYQRAVIAFDGATEVLMLQSKFEGRAKDFGWVIPLPRVPELAGTSGPEAESLFRALSKHVLMEKVQPRVLLLAMILVPVAILALLTVKSKFYVFLIMVVLYLILVSIYIPNFSFTTVPAPVEIIAAKKVGVHEVKVIRGSDPGAILTWLQERDYGFDEKDTAVFREYMDKGWVFVTSRLTSEAAADGTISSGGMVAPLIMRFDADAPVYPLALTGTGGHETKLRLFVLAEHKVTASPEIKMMYADFKPVPDILNRLLKIAYKGDHGKTWEECEYMTLFEDTLTPERMKTDLHFTAAPDDDSHRGQVLIKATWRSWLVFVLSAGLIILRLYIELRKMLMLNKTGRRKSRTSK